MDDLDMTALRETAKEIEASLHEKGWDSDPLFGWLVREQSRLDENNKVLFYGVIPHPFEPGRRDRDSVQGLHLILEDLMQTGRPQMMCYHPTMSGFVGMVFSHEGWATLAGTDGMDRKEVRFVVVMAGDGTTLSVTRFRGVGGEDDVISVVENPPEKLRELLELSIVNALARCMILIGMVVPDAAPVCHRLLDELEGEL